MPQGSLLPCEGDIMPRLDWPTLKAGSWKIDGGCITVSKTLIVLTCISITKLESELPNPSHIIYKYRTIFCVSKTEFCIVGTCI